ncbi:regulator [Streptomyces sp. SID13031]|nr:regulator [Streptomyces sp. SID13031]
MEAFADTVVPGAKRYSGDAAVAGVAGPPGGADIGFLDLLRHPLVALGPLLPEMAAGLNVAATAYAVAHLIPLPWGLPPFVGLAFPHRTAVLTDLFQRDRPDRLIWILLALLVSAAFDSAPHRHTVEALSNGHPGLKFLGFPAVGPDGRWRCAEFSYGRQLANPHPATTAKGSPS